MKQDKTYSPDNPVNPAHSSRRQFILPPITVLTTTAILEALAHEHQIFSKSVGAKLKPGDTMRIEPATGEPTPIAREHGSVVNPCPVAMVPSSGPTHTGQHNN